MMFIKKLFVCCYRFQEHVGNEDIPVFMSMGMVLFAVYLYLSSMATGVSFYWQNIIGNPAVLGHKTLTFCNILICSLLGGMFYLKYIRGFRLKGLLSIKISTSDKVLTTVFLIGSILCLCTVLILMWAVNNGFILERR